MNRSNFNQTGGYPLKTERLEELQTAYQILNAFGSLAGNLTIISGCVSIGATVGDGFVYINNELLEFRSGIAAVDSEVIIIEEPVNRAFENGTVKEVHVIRYAAFGTADQSWLWSDFKRPIETKTLESRLSSIEKKLSIFQPGGAVFAWFKPVADIPAGFQEVVNMRGRTVFGYDPAQTEFNLIGKPGGSPTKQLSVAELPTVKPINGTFFKKGTGFGGTTGLTVGDTGGADFAEGELIKPFGGDQPFSILNPYRVAAYIEYIG